MRFIQLLYKLLQYFHQNFKSVVRTDTILFLKFTVQFNTIIIGDFFIVRIDTNYFLVITEVARQGSTLGACFHRIAATERWVQAKAQCLR